jgi:hypothetical protein
LRQNITEKKKTKKETKGDFGMMALVQEEELLCHNIIRALNRV